VTTVARRLAIVLVVLTTAACALTNTGDPSSAAIVGDERISAAEVERHIDSIRNNAAFREVEQTTTGDLAAQAQAQVVTTRVISAILDGAAQRNDVQVSDADVEAALDEITEQIGGAEQLQQALVQQGRLDLLDPDLLQDQLRDQEIWAALQERPDAEADFEAFMREETAGVSIKINPRYGAWDATALAVTPTDPLAPDGQASPAPAS
jgi:hypothetical protein